MGLFEFWKKRGDAPKASAPKEEAFRGESGVQEGALTVMRGWYNAVTGQGTSGSDSAVYSKYAGYPPVEENEADALWNSSALAATVAEAVPHDAAAPGEVLDMPGEDSEEVTRKVKAALEGVPYTCQGDAAQGARSALLKVEDLARVFGGGLLVGVFDDMGSGDARGMEGVLTEGAHLLSLRGYQRWEISKVDHCDDPTVAEYGHPEVYHVTPRSAGNHQEQTYSVHASRCIRLGGVVTSAKAASENQGWGDSVYRRTREALEAYAAGRGSLRSTLKDVNLYAVGIEGLAAKRSRDSTGAVNARLHEQAMMRSRYGTQIYDRGKEEVGFRSPSLSGVADLLDRQAYDVSQASGITMTRLFGQAPGGLSTDDASGTRNYHDQLQAYRDKHQYPALCKLWLWGLWLIDADTSKPWSVKQKALGAPSAQEALEIEKLRAEIYASLIDANTPATVAAGILEGSEALSATDLRDLLKGQQSKEKGSSSGVSSEPADV